MKLPEWLKEARAETCPAGKRFKPPGFIEKNLSNIASFIRSVLDSEETASRSGFLQNIDPRVRIAGILELVSAAAITKSAWLLGVVAVIIFFLLTASRIHLRELVKRVLPSFIFTFVLVIPVFFSFVTPGSEIFRIPGLENIAVTEEGIKVALFFITRATAMISLVSLLLLTTRQTDFFRGLRRLPVPSLFVTALFMTFRHIFILLKIAEDASLARKSRTIGGAKLRESQMWFASRITLILKKSMNMAEEVNMAMTSRGFTGKVKTFENGPLTGRDYAWLAFATFMLFLSFGI